MGQDSIAEIFDEFLIAVACINPFFHKEDLWCGKVTNEGDHHPCETKNQNRERWFSSFLDFMGGEFISKVHQDRSPSDTIALG